MRIHVEKFGPINEGSISLKPLTIFIGLNNTGKTWVSNAIYSIISVHGFRSYINYYIQNYDPAYYPHIQDFFDQIVNQGNCQVDLIEFFDLYGQKYFNEIAKLAPKFLKSFMGSDYADFSKTKISIDITNDIQTYKQNILDMAIPEKSTRISVDKDNKALLNAVKNKGDKYLFFYTEKESISGKIPESEIIRFIANVVFMMIHRSIYRDVTFFPIERTGFASILSKTAIDVKSDSIEEHDNSDEDRKQLSKPIQDLLNVYFSGYTRKKDRLTNLSKSDKNYKKISDLIKIMEKKIFEGEIDYYDSKNSKELIFKLNNKDNTVLDIPAVSSMIKELSSIITYLRYSANPKELIIIDEPEMNLHPIVQVKLMEFIAMLVNAQISVLVTTHSPYLIDHLTNLIKASKSPEPEKIKRKFFLKNSDAFISADKVSVIQFNKGKVENILNDNGLIDWDSFSKVSETIANLYYEI